MRRRNRTPMQNARRSISEGLPNRLAAGGISGPSGGTLNTTGLNKQINSAWKQIKPNLGPGYQAMAGANSGQMQLFDAVPELKTRYLAELYPGVNVNDSHALMLARRANMMNSRGLGTGGGVTWGQNLAPAPYDMTGPAPAAPTRPPGGDIVRPPVPGMKSRGLATHDFTRGAGTRQNRRPLGKDNRIGQGGPGAAVGGFPNKGGNRTAATQTQQQGGFPAQPPAPPSFLPMTTGYLDTMRGANDQLSAAQSAYTQAAGLVDPMLQFQLARMNTDKGYNENALKEQLAERGIYESGVTPYLMNRDVAIPYGRGVQDLGLSADQQYSQLAQQLAGANLGYNQSMAEALLQRAYDAAQQMGATGAELPTFGYQSPSFYNKPKKNTRRSRRRNRSRNRGK